MATINKPAARCDLDDSIFQQLRPQKYQLKHTYCNISSNTSYQNQTLENY
jgi:hypothetical protein